MNISDLFKEENRRKLQVAVLLVIFIVLLGLGLWIHFRPGIYVGVDNEFLYRKNAETYQSGSDEITVRQEENKVWFYISVDGEVKTAEMVLNEVDSLFGDRQISITFNDGEVIEGVWGNDGELVNESGLPLWWDNGIFAVVNGERVPGGNLTLANVLCKIALDETEQSGSMAMLLFGAFWYIVGAIGFLFPEETHFLFTRWRYNQPELSDAGIWWEKAGSVAVMVLGAVFMLRMLMI